MDEIKQVEILWFKKKEIQVINLSFLNDRGLKKLWSFEF